MRYAWNRSRGVEAQIVGDTVTSIAEANGGVCSPSLLVEHARNPDSDLHCLFEWDDHLAAEAHRREQARTIVRELRVIERTDAGERRVQAFVHVLRVEDDTLREGYRLTKLVVRNRDEHQQMLDEAVAQLRGWRSRYARLEALADVFDVVDDVLAWRG